MDVKRLESYAEEHLSDLLRSMFQGPEFNGRFKIEREMEQFASDSRDIYDIKKGNRLEYFSIFFDDEFMCSFKSNTHPTKVDSLFLSGFLESYQDGNIYLTKGLYLEKEKERKATDLIENEVKKIKAEKGLEGLTGDERRLAKEVISDAVEGKFDATTK